MAPSKPTNFKTYEAMSRLIAALLAAHPELKPNYREIAKCYGGTQTASALEHRFRPLRAAAQALRIMVDKGQDPAEIEDVMAKNAVDIATHFGGSTPDGLQFQFRQIKANAEALKNAVKNGEDPIEAFTNSNGAPKNASNATPGNRKRGRPAADPTTPKSKGGGSGAVATPSRTKSIRKTTKAVQYKEEDEEEDDEQSPVDYSELDLSPIKQPKKIKTTPAKVSKISETTAASASATSSKESAVPASANAGSDEVIFMKEEIVNDDAIATSNTHTNTSSTSNATQPQTSYRTANATLPFGNQIANSYAAKGRTSFGYYGHAGASFYGDYVHDGYQHESHFSDAFQNAQIGHGPTTTTNDFDMEVSDDDHGAI
ncbi:hypothetical protein V8F20_006354 [Naviculisporaceae sp. PSN 640]